MCRCLLGIRWIKVLADLRHVVGTFFYRHAGPNGPEEGSLEARHALRRTLLLLQILLHVCSSRSPDLELFGLRRARTT